MSDLGSAAITVAGQSRNVPLSDVEGGITGVPQHASFLAARPDQ